MPRRSPPAPPVADREGGTPLADRAAVPRMPSQPRQRRPGIIALGVLAVVGGGLLTYQTVARLDHRTPVVVTARDVAVGQRIAAADVTTARVASDSQVAMIPGRRLDRVIGAVATVDLRRGALVPPDAVGGRLNPSPGQQLVPVAVKPSRLPARGLRPGDHLLVVPTLDSTSGDPAAKAPPGSPSISAVVDRITEEPDTDGMVVVDLIAADGDGSRLAQQAEDGSVAFVLTSRSR